MSRRNASLLLLLVLTAIVATYFAWPSKDEPLSIKLLDCPNPVAGCGDGGSMQMRFDHAPKALQPFGIDLSLPTAEAVHMQFTMDGMEMGTNRYRMVRRSDGTWHAEVTLPVCMHGRSDWLALVEASMAGGTSYYQFRFSAER